MPCVTPNRDRGQVTPQGHKRLFKFDELSAQRLTSPETKVTTPAGKGHACCLCDMLHCKQFEQRREGSLWWFGTASQVGRECRFQRFAEDGRNSGTSQKRLKNGMADCFTLLERIARLKCVNPVVKSVLSHPKKGCLNWLHGTMSESPWKSH